MGVKLITDDRPIKVYRKDRTSKAGNPYTTYSIRVSSKDTDNNWQSAFIDVLFKKGVSVNDKCEIAIKNAFPVVDEYNGTTRTKWFITDFDVVTEGNAVITDANGFMDIPDGDQEELPFY